jgi:hypothetical protein
VRTLSVLVAITATALISVGASAIAQTSAYADSAHWARYKPGSLQQYIREKTHAVLDGTRADEKELAIGAPRPMRVRVVFLGRTRAVSNERRLLIAGWARSFRLDTALVQNQYTREVLVREGKRRFWLPVQTQTWENTQDLWRVNRPIVALVQAIGAVVINRIPDWIFLVMTVEPPSDA